MQLLLYQLFQAQGIKTGHVSTQIDLAVGFQITALVIKGFQCGVFFRNRLQVDLR